MSFKEEIEEAKRKAYREAQFNKAYIIMAATVATLSYCKKRQVGAVLVNNGNIVGYGFNGAVSGMPNICEDDQGADERTVDVHAEMNAILKAGTQSCGAVMYVTTYPCPKCTILIAQAGIKRIYYLEDYKTDGRVELYGMTAIKIEL